MSDDDEVHHYEDIWIIEGHDGRSRTFETRVSTMSQYHMRLLLQHLASRHMSPQQVVDAVIARTDDLEIDEASAERVTLSTRGNPRYVATLWRGDEIGMKPVA